MKNPVGVIKTEEEQAQQIKEWLKNNLIQIILGVAIGVSGIWGWGAYKDHKQGELIKARENYLAVVSDPKNIENLQELQNNYADNTHTQQAALLMAKYAVEDKNYDKAIDYLAPITSAESVIIANTAKLRLASVYLELKKYNQALAVLSAKDNNSFSSLFNNLKGDIYFANNDISAAKEHYELAIKDLRQNSQLKSLIQLKINNLN